MVERRVVCQEEKKIVKKSRNAVDSDWLSENTQSRQRDKGNNRNVEKSLERKSSHVWLVERKSLVRIEKRRES